MLNLVAASLKQIAAYSKAIEKGCSFLKLPIENIYWCTEFNLVTNVNIVFARCLINIISCSIVLNIVLSLCSVTKANAYLNMFSCFEGLFIYYNNTVNPLCTGQSMKQLFKLVKAWRKQIDSYSKAIAKRCLVFYWVSGGKAWLLVQIFLGSILMTKHRWIQYIYYILFIYLYIEDFKWCWLVGWLVVSFLF